MIILKIILTLLLILVPALLIKGQTFMNARIGYKDTTYQWFIAGTERWVMKAKDSTYAYWKTNQIKWTQYNASRDDGAPQSILWADTQGNIKRSPASSIVAVISATAVIAALGYTPYSTANPNNYITAPSSAQVTAALGYVPLQLEVDGNTTNEIQILSLSSGSLQLSLNGGTITLPTTDLGNYYTKTQSDATFKPISYSPTNSEVIAAIGYTPLQSEVDGSVSNEIQTLSGSGRSFTLSNGGGTRTIPVTTWDSITSKPNFATVATSGSYNDLSNKPSIPSAQVNSDWSSSSGVSQVLNKPTTLAGYGITDAQSKINGTGFVKSTGTVVSYDNSTYLTAEVDGSTSNEIQTLSTSGQSVSISSGNTILLNNPVTFYNASGTVVAVTKVWQAIISPSISASYSIDISAAGFSNVTNVSVMAAKNTTVVSSCPNASIKAFTTTQVVVNITETNTAIVQILGINVLSGLPVIFANTTGLTIHLEVKGN